MTSSRIFRVLRPALLLVGIAGFLFLFNCTSRKLIVPPVSEKPTGVYLYGKFVWHDLLTYDMEAVKKFYGELFGWTFDNSESPDYTVIRRDGVPIGGIVLVKELEKKHFPAQWMSYLSVPDVDKAVALLKAKGGVVLRGPWNIKKRGRMAIVRDPQGALLAFLHSATGDPPDHEPGNYEWLWNENLTSDVPAAVSFYQELVGYESEILTDPKISGVQVDYFVMKKDGKPRAGITRIPWEGVKPNWLAYLKVADPRPLVAQVEKLGGKVYLKPDEKIRGGSVAFIADPTGAVVALQKWPLD